ncbi:SDR family NAD(P)-dependent oxidoreductase [Mesoterricola sediminis]|uniref:Short-chain dehydrogenase n=1 Tax=Mesoterricola sediminis TaxID=2927980 RepID=A0AA48H2V8_9BACT|nr:SDR family oxidoreductase [Mesoterricola sediminis]BDU76471.1 short-chain dehydrogenase [Mesoterricola sediminis]
MKPFAGRRVLVSGAGSGLGRDCARRLGALGADLILVGRRREPLEATWPVADIRPLDHADDAAVAALAAACPALDGLVLCAGALATGSVEGSPEATFDAMIAANLKGPWLMCHHLGPRLAPGASVVLLGSNIGIRAIPDSAAYCVAKAGVHMLAQVLALEWAPRGIRVNAIAPGPVRTAMVDARIAGSPDPAAALEALSAVNPMRRMGTGEEIAALAEHLLGDGSRWTTGTVIPVDGGATAVF